MLYREECESSLQFAGFVVISCPLKRDSKGIIKELLNASHHVVMITGDNALTACHVAKELKFTCKDKGSPGMAIMAKSSQDESCSSWEFQSVEGACIASVPPPSSNSRSLLSGLKTSLSKHDVCVTGDGLAYLQKGAYTLYPLSPIRVFSSPLLKLYLVSDVIGAY